MTDRNTRARRTLIMSARESAFLLNLLVDNAREWNRELREQLQTIVSDTEAYNARVAMHPGYAPTPPHPGG